MKGELTGKTLRRQVRHGESIAHLIKTEHANHVWSMDFQYDVTRDGNVLKIVSVIDEFTREPLLDIAERSVNTDVLSKTLNKVFNRLRAPRVLRMGNEPDFLSRHLQRLRGRRIGMAFVGPGAPCNNGYVELFNTHCIRECLRRQNFANLIEARQTSTESHLNYNRRHRRSVLGYLTPSEYLEQWKNKPNILMTSGSKNGDRPVLLCDLLLNVNTPINELILS